MTEHQSRTPAGVPTGGQFAVSQRSEAEVDLSESTRPVRLVDTDAATPSGLVIEEHEFNRDYPFDRVYVQPGTDGYFHVAAQNTVNVVDGLTEAVCQAGTDPDEWAGAEKASFAWLKHYSRGIRTWVAETYPGAETTDHGLGFEDAENWQAVRISVYGPRLDPITARTDEVLDAANTDAAQRLRADLDSGAFYTRMLDEVR